MRFQLPGFNPRQLCVFWDKLAFWGQVADPRGIELNLKRSQYTYFHIGDEQGFDLAALLRGKAQSLARPVIQVLVPFHSTKRVQITLDQVSFLASLPSDRWLALDGVVQSSVDSGRPLSEDAVEELIGLGIVITDRDDPTARRFRKLEEDYAACQWHPDAVIFHAMTKMTEPVETADEYDVRTVTRQAEESAQGFVDRFGPPPPATVSFGGDRPEVPLPPTQTQGGLYEALRSRRTVRTFDDNEELALEPFSTLLKYTFGCQGRAQLSPDIELLHKTSPSGGSLHPIEAFPLVLNVAGLSPGTYHYNVGEHTLSPLVEMEAEEARSFVRDLGRGQLFAAEAHALVILVARFFRNQWKYRKVARTYSVMMMDAGHLSQVFYLTATAQGLGAFYTGAINSQVMEDHLGLNPAEYGVLGLCGCGIVSKNEADRLQGGLPFSKAPGTG